MTTLTIRNFDERTAAQLRIQAARHGRSMEEVARTILHSALEARQPPPLVARDWAVASMHISPASAAWSWS